ncbi:CmpA/NrtA family ABC transporter substrate-binding protein [Novosphingobium sp. AP12]|uniref:CmpA/NrtA family ABC transporter substrate-binding protein n=1 Tax=Novosphingobium sp. AP12 TaxID=1144305 RepID=UPI000271E741|nr:CmpA/NrtA family ABC transporter substrate-binding protein [Novosphingobium sp. AP12]EJL31305.1 ABC-type nitrate/sulfonate/bicarbonate transport system, periplasmic component [Novosphingobium sp. AP12]
MRKVRGNGFTRQAAAVALMAGAALAGCGKSDAPTEAAKVVAGGVEKPSLKLGFIKLTDMAPLAIAKEKGFFAEEGLNVMLEPQANWKVLLDGVIGAQLDGAHMLAGQPIAATLGLGTKAEMIAPISLDLNGNAITLSNRVWSLIEPTLPKGADGEPVHPISASVLQPVVQKFRQEGKPFKMGMVFPVSTHNYELRYWLAAGGLNPGYYLPGDVGGTTSADVQLSVTPPPQMPATLEAGTIEGYSVGEPWSQAAVKKKIGVPVITDDQIWHDNPEKVLGLRKDFADKYPGTTAALLRAIIKAQQWLDADGGRNRAEAVQILSRSNYVGADADVIAASMTGKFTFGPGDTRDAAGFNVFFDRFAGYPFYSDAIWTMTQMRRWGQLSVDHDDAWYAAQARAVYRPDLYLAAAKALADRKVIPAAAIPQTDGFKPLDTGFIDHVPYDGHKPNAYIQSLRIGLKQGQKVTASGVTGY